MPTKLFSRLSYLLFLFQIPCFAASQTISSSSNNVVVSPKCTCRENCIKVEKDPKNEILTFGYIRELGSKMEDVTIPDDIKSLCLIFFEIFIPGRCMVLDSFQRIENYESSKDFRILSQRLKIYAIENAEDRYGKTPFLFAAFKGHLQVLKLLKKNEADVHTTNKEGNTALHFACGKGNLEMATWLIDVCGLHIEAKNTYGETPFFFAARKGQLDILELLYKRRANINTKNREGDSALHYVCQRGRIFCVKFLVRRGANVNSEDRHGYNVLHYACKNEYLKICRWLLNNSNINLKAKGGYSKITPLLCAALNGQLEILKLLKKNGANVSAADKYGNNALHWACEIGKLEMATWLIDVCGLHIEAKNNREETAFLFAAEKGHVGILELLYKRRANINTKNEEGDSALHYVCRRGRIGCVKFLVRREANINTKNKDGKTAIELAKTEGHKEIVEFLKKTQKKIDADFREAARKGEFEVLKDLYTKGANVNKADKYGKTALELAKTEGHKEIVAFLEIIQKQIDAAFLIAAKKGNLQVLKLLKEIGVDVKLKYVNIALDLAKREDHKEIVKFLETISKG